MSEGSRLGLIILLAAAVAACDGRSSPTTPTRYPPQRSTPMPPPPPAPTGRAVRVPTPPVPAASQTNPLVGRYDLQVTIADCPTLPSEVTQRIYTATFKDLAGNVGVTLSEASFLEEAACQHPDLPSREAAVCNHMLGGHEDFDEGSYWFVFRAVSGTPIVERLSSGAWVELDGGIYGRFADGSLVTTGSVTVSYWSGDPVGSSYVSCRSEDARMLFTPE